MVLVNPPSTDSSWSPGSDLALSSNRNIVYMLSSLGILAFVGLLAFATTPSVAHANSGTVADYTLSTLARVDRKEMPSIYRFDRVSDSMPDERRLPHVWSMFWYNAGWKPEQLMVEQLSSQVEYLELRERLVKTKLLPIQQRHIMKYIAMSAVGGGWLAHGDTFPLNPFGEANTLPNEGKMSVFDDKFPCLMSGSATEWMRMANDLVVHAERYNEPLHWTEPKALEDLKANIITVSETFNLHDMGVKDAQGEQSWAWTSSECEATHNMRAVHFLVDFLEDFSQLPDPADMVTKWLSMWLHACERTTGFIDKKGGRKAKEINDAMMEQVKRRKVRQALHQHEVVM